VLWARKPNGDIEASLHNALAGEERMITSPMAGTTIDSIDSLVEIDGESFVFIDTAGIRKKIKTEQGVEVLSVIQSRKAIERADVAILVVDGEQGPTDQDEKIAGIIEEVGCGVILALNKWDTQASKKDFTEKEAAERIRDTMRFLGYAPLVFMSAKKKTGMGNLPALIKEIVEQRQVRISTHELTEWVRTESEIHNPHGAKFYLCQQAGKYPPTFVCHVNDPDKVDFSLRRHLVNSIREKWGYMGSPIRFVVTKSESSTK
jgi:GTP-binding protein